MCSDLPSLLASVLIAVAVSCSVTEDRDGCPCQLGLIFPGDRLPATLSIVDGDDVIVEDVVNEAGKYVARIPRGKYFMNVYCSDGGLFNYDKGLAIPYGSACPEVFSLSKTLDASSLHLEDTVKLHKNYCCIILTMKSPKENETASGYRFAIKGNVCGYDIHGLPVEGGFSCMAEKGRDGLDRVTVPRQRDASLLLEITGKGEPVRTFAIGEYIAASGYDWTAVDLEDIELEIDYSETDIYFGVSLWSMDSSVAVEI